MDRELEVVRLWSPVISFCRCYGVIPLKKCNREPYFDHCIGSYCLSFVLSLNLTFNVLLASYILVISFEDSLIKIFEIVTYVVYYCQCEYTLLFFFLNSGDLLGLFQQWIETEKALVKFDIRLGKKTMIQCWIFYALTIIVSTFDSLSFFFFDSMLEWENSKNLQEFLENVGGVEKTLNFGSFKTAVCNFVVIVTIIISETAWIAGDVIITLVSILLYRYYEALHEKLSVSIQNKRYSRDQFDEFHRSIQVISLLAKRVAETFSKLVVTTVSCNTIQIFYYLCRGLQNIMTSSNIPIVGLTLLFSFGYLVLRFSLSLYMASRLTEKPAEILNSLYQLPSMVSRFKNDQQHNRLIKLELIIDHVQSLSIDLAGDGFIRISKPTISSLCGLVVTYVLLMLQYN